MDYCAPGDLYSLGGLQPGALPNQGRLVKAADSSPLSFGLDQHGFALNDIVTLRAEAGGTLAAPLAVGVVYYAIPITDSRLALAATINGSAIVLSTPGARMLLIRQLPFAGSISWASRIIDQNVPANLIPFDSTQIPDIIRMTCAELAAGHLMQATGGASAQLGLIVDVAMKRLANWARGVPLRGANTAPAANLSVSLSVSAVDCRGWSRFGGTN